MAKEDVVIVEAVDSYIAVKRAAGFSYKTGGLLLESFARFASERGDSHVRAATATQWSALGPSPHQRERRLQAVVAFAQYAHVEDPRHQVPSAGVFARGGRRRPTPFIFSPAEVRALMSATHRLAPKGSFRPLLYETLFGLLAATGMRISEALGLRLEDLTDDGLVIRRTKFKKARLLPLTASTRRALARYVAARRHFAGDHLFDNGRGRPLEYSLTRWTFSRLIRWIGLGAASRGRPRPHIHSLRHTFAVRALEACPTAQERLARHIVGLSTYLGHVHLSCTYWYLQATPQLLRAIAERAEATFAGSCP